MQTIRSAALTAVALSLAFGAATAASAESASVLRAAPRVTNGVLTQQRPTTGGLLASSGNNHQVICSGTLIGCETFLTAAHCVCDGSTFASCGTPQASDYSVYLQNVGIVGVAAIDVDPAYSFGTSGDVAVLTLSSPITGVAPTPINTTMRPAFGTSAEIVGFGLTQGGANDTGLLRRGLTETGACEGAADSDNHVCWSFTDPLGLPGEDSNTCNGDSGGPLFADLGMGDSVVGITSGGSSADCLPTDVSYDADVYVHRAFIEAVAGADLLNTSCGSISQVGDPGSTVTTFDFDLMTKSAQSCRKSFSKMMSTYENAVLKATRACLDGVNDGTRTAPCPDAEAMDDIAAAAARVDETKLGAKCTASVIPLIGAAGDCLGAADAGDLAACILVAGDAAAADAIDSEYADAAPAGPIADEAALACQEAVGKAGGALVKASLKAKTKCQVSLAAGKVDQCPDAKALDSVAKAESKAESTIEGACTNGAVATLDGLDAFGGTCAGVTDVAALVACNKDDHATITDELVALLDDDIMLTDVQIAVLPGTSRLRFTVNGKDDGTNDLDLFVKLGSVASPSSYDARSINGGMFEEIEINSPTAGTWNAHIETFAGPARIPYQLTVTALEP